MTPPIDASTDTSFSLEAGGYQFKKTLSPADPLKTFLCLDDRGNPVVMKRLDAECLHRDQLHPAIKERLARIRELPHPRVATLRGVERFGGGVYGGKVYSGGVYMVWNYLPGTAWEQAQGSPEKWTQRGRDLVSVVESLHAAGIVHGSLHPRNIILTDTGEVWLTDFSPYLYTDANVDIEAVLAIVRENLPDEQAGALNQFDAQFDSEIEPEIDSHPRTLRDLANALTPGSGTPLPTVGQDDRGARRGPLIGAALVVLGCCVIAFILRQRFR